MTNTLLNKDITTSIPLLQPFPTLEKNSRNLAFAFSFISTLFAGVLSMLMSVYLPSVVNDLVGTVNPDKLNEISAVINSLFIFGWMFGGFCWGLICDRIGRSRSVVYSTICYGLFGIATALASNWMVAGISRFFTGFGIGGVLVTTTILISEIWPDKKRGSSIGGQHR